MNYRVTKALSYYDTELITAVKTSKVAPLLEFDHVKVLNLKFRNIRLVKPI